MAQYDFGTIDPNTKSGTALASDLNSYRNAVNSMHSGSAAPSYITAGMMWVDTTSADYEVKLYDGAQSITVAIIDATNNVARVAVDPAETSYITSTTSAQIRHVIASTNIFTTRSTGIQFNLASPTITDNNSNEWLSFTTTASAVNHIDIANSATGGAVALSAVGTDTNISIALTPKGTGVIEVNGQASFSDGTVAAPSITNTGDTNTGMFFPAADTVAVTTGGAEVARFDSSGNLGIGTTSPASFLGTVKLVVGSAATTTTPSAVTVYSGTATYGGLYFADGTAGDQLYRGAVEYNHSTDALLLYSTGQERARIDSAGNVGIGTNTLVANRRLQVDGGALIASVFKNSASANEVIDIWNSATSGNNVFVEWQTEAGSTARGSVSYNRGGGLVAYNTTSDYRAKDIAGKISDASSTVLSLKPYMGTMKGATIERPMFIAHETQEIAPYAVTGEKDAVDTEGNPTYQQMDHSALVPLLTAALQEALNRIASIEARLTALETQ